MKRWQLIGLFTLLTAGCSVQGGHPYVDGKCLTCFNNPFTGEALTYDKAEKARIQAKLDPTKAIADIHQSEIYRWYENKDLDTVHNRILDELDWDFGFLPRKAKIDDSDPTLEAVYFENYAAEGSPGVYYNVTDYMWHRYRLHDYPVVLNIHLAKDGRGTDVQLKVLYSKSVDANKMVKDIAKRFMRAIRKQPNTQ